MLWVRERRKNKKIPSNGEELDKITITNSSTKLKQMCLSFLYEENHEE